MAKFGLAFTVITSPFAHAMHTRVLPGLFPESTKFYLLKRTVFHQTFFASTCIGAFYYFLSMLDGKSMKECWADTKRTWWPAFKANQLVWYPANYITFKYFTMHYQFVFMSVVQVFFNVILSYIHYSSKKQQQQEVASEPMLATSDVICT